MARYKSWLSGTRQGQLDMALLWLEVLPEETEDEAGEVVPKWRFWGLTQGTLTEFAGFVGAAQEALNDAKNDEKRTKVVNQRVADTFKALVRAMRGLKKSYFHVPPLTDADLVSLGLSVPDTTHSFSGAPTAQVIPDLYLTTGRYELGVRARYLKGSPDEKANKTYEYWYVLKAPGEPPPLSPAELTKLFDTQRKNDTIPFEYGDSGKIAYVACRLANGKLKGPWGPIVSALIP